MIPIESSECDQSQLSPLPGEALAGFDQGDSLFPQAIPHTGGVLFNPILHPTAVVKGGLP